MDFELSVREISKKLNVLRMNHISYVLDFDKGLADRERRYMKILNVGPSENFREDNIMFEKVLEYKICENLKDLDYYDVVADFTYDFDSNKQNHIFSNYYLNPSNVYSDYFVISTIEGDELGISKNDILLKDYEVILETKYLENKYMYMKNYKPIITRVYKRYG